MIRTKELRIGNLLQDVGLLIELGSLVDELVVFKIEHGVVVCGDDAFSYPYLDEHLRGIPLDANWLTRCGFEEISEGHYWRNLANDYSLCSVNNVNEVGLYFAEGNYTGFSVNYVHQLQNLFYALTQTELTVNASKL